MTYLSFLAMSFAGGALAGGVVALIVARCIAGKAHTVIIKEAVAATYDRAREVPIGVRR